jgi:AcrR family transcriptional regulator
MTSAQQRIHEAALRLFAEKGTSAITVSELAAEAGIARGTIYNNIESPSDLFETVAAELASEMYQRVTASFADVADPAERLTNGIRFFIRRAHDEPHWGRFLVRFSFSSRSLQSMWDGPPMEDLLIGLSQRRYDFPPGQLPSVVAVIAGSTIASMGLVLKGYKTWQDAGSETAALVLRSLGISSAEARRLASKKLPLLPVTAERAEPSRRKRGEQA